MRRGVVDYDEQVDNYSFHQVLIPSGTTVRDKNFMQISPNVDAIVKKPGFGRNITFEGCNLVNVKTHASWTIVDSNNAQQDSEVIRYDGVGAWEIGRTEFVAANSRDVKKQRTVPAWAVDWSDLGS
jgi:hypothetical protein